MADGARGAQHHRRHGARFPVKSHSRHSPMIGPSAQDSSFSEIHCFRAVSLAELRSRHSAVRVLSGAGWTLEVVLPLQSLAHSGPHIARCLESRSSAMLLRARVRFLYKGRWRFQKFATLLRPHGRAYFACAAAVHVLGRAAATGAFPPFPNPGVLLSPFLVPVAPQLQRTVHFFRGVCWERGIALGYVATRFPTVWDVRSTWIILLFLGP